MKPSPKDISGLRANKANPRRITDPRLAQLKKSMAEFGDLGGIVRNVHPDAGGDKHGELIGGHQRIEAYRKAKDATIHLEKTYDKPTRAGTTAEGYVLIAGERFAYREVNWPVIKAKAAMLSANKNAGTNDMTALTSIINELAASEFDMALTMFDDDELLAYLPDSNDLAEAPLELGDTEAEHETKAEAPAVGTVSAQPTGVPVSHIKMVQLFFREDDHRKFVELTDALKEVYKKDNLSDTVMEAIKRASISAVVK